MSDTTPIDVLVVGSGPVGLTAAIEVARLHRSVRIIDCADGPATSSRALGVHARTQEVLDRLGLLEQLHDRATPVAAFTVHAAGHRLARLQLDLTPTPTIIGASSFLAQVDTEALLRSALDHHHVTPEWQTTLLGFEQDEGGVRAHVAHTDRPDEVISARYLVGADGGRSTVRHLTGLRMEGDSDETWLVADATLDWQLPHDSIHLVRTRTGTVVAFPFPEPRRWRLLDTTETSTVPPDAMAERFTRKLASALRSPVHVSDITWSSEFTIQQRAVPQLRAGRVFLAGDAAHVHSPASGQGMNTGIQDAVNLGWKLVAALNGAPDILLDTYTQERRPVSADLLVSAAVATRLLQGRTLPIRLGTRLALPLLGLIPALQQRVNRRAAAAFSALTIRSDPSMIVAASKDASTGPLPGERITHYTSDDASAERIRDALRVPGWLMIRKDGMSDTFPAVTTLDLAGRLPRNWPDHVDWYLVRPDGVVAARGPRGTMAPQELLVLASAL